MLVHIHIYPPVPMSVSGGGRKVEEVCKVLELLCVAGKQCVQMAAHEIEFHSRQFAVI